MPKEEPASKMSKTTSSSNPSDADHAENATSGISNDGIILLLCMKFILFYFIILPHTMNYKQNKNDNK